jgi:hypothetical protein
MAQGVVIFLQRLFEDDVIVDNRNPIWRGEIPLLTGQYEMYMPNPEVWKQLVVFVVLQSIIQMSFAAMIYQLVVQQRGTVQSYLIGFGIILPVSSYIPFFLLETLDIRNKVITLSSTTVMTVIFFRCIEAMYGTSPSNGVMESSMWNYCMYYSSVAPFVWDIKTKRRKAVTMQRLLFSLVDILVHFFAVSLVLSFLKPYRYNPFDDPVHLTELKVSWHMFRKEHLLNSYCQAGEKKRLKKKKILGWS